METVPLTIRVSKEELERLRALAVATDRSVSFHGHQAVARYLAQEAWQIAAIEEALATSRAGEPTVSHEKVAAWLDSWGTAEEQPRPR
jgi:predicted transcriptional regulator